MLKLESAPYQQRFLTDLSKRVVLKWPRQSGKSTTLAVKALWFTIMHPGITTLIVSPSLRQSINLRDIIAGLVERLPIRERKVWVKRLLRTTIYCWRGSRIVALPANPETLRGYTAHMILVDEADFFHEPEKMFYGTLYPMLTTTDGWLIVSSTPWTTKGFYYKICSDPGYSKHFINWRDAVKAGIAKQAVIDEAQLNNPPEIFRREYLCEFAEDVDVFLPSDLIAKCIDANLEYYQFEAQPTGEFYAGLDLGKHQDYSVLIIFERRGNDFYLVHSHRFPLETSYASVIGYVKTLCDRCKHIHAIHVDMTGVGDYVCEDMKAAGISNVEGIKFTTQIKETMAVPFKQAMINGTIKIPYDRDLIAELNIERYEMSRDGHYRFTHPERSHDDRFWAAVLAFNAARTGGIQPYRSIIS